MYESIPAGSDVVCYEYDDYSIRLWFRNHDVCEFTVDLVGNGVLGEMKRLADLGHGLMGYLTKSRIIANVKPRKWKEWLPKDAAKEL